MHSAMFTFSLINVRIVFYIFREYTTSLSAPEVKKFVPSGCYEVT